MIQPKLEGLDVTALIARLKDADSEVRRAAAYALGKRQDRIAFDPLIEALQDQVPAVRIAAAYGLMHLGDERAIPLLITCLDDEVENVRMSVASCLGDLSTHPADLLLDLLHDPVRSAQARAPIAWTLQGFEDARIVPALLQTLADESGDVRGLAAESLGQLRDLRAVEPLLALLDTDQDGEVRWQTAIALGHLGDKRALEPLIAALGDPASIAREGAAQGLACLGDVRAVEPLCALLTDAESEVRWWAGYALRELDDPRAVEPLLAALQDEANRVRDIAASGLGYLGDRRAVGPLLKVAAEDPSEEVRETAVYALVMLGDATYLDVVLANLKTRPRSIAAEALGRLGDPRGVEPLIEALKIKEPRSGYLRCMAARALGQLGDARAIPALEAALDDRSIYVREAAREALDAIRNQSAAPK